MQKGYPRRERAHLDPPALVQTPEGRICYAVVFGFYQLHGQEGELKGLRDQSGAASLREPPTAGDVRETIRQGGKKPSEDPRASHPVDDTDLTETSTSGAEDEPEKKAGPLVPYDELLAYTRRVDGLLTSALQLTRDMAMDRGKQAGRPTGFAKRYNDLKGEWKAVGASAGEDLIREVRGE